MGSIGDETPHPFFRSQRPLFGTLEFVKHFVESRCGSTQLGVGGMGPEALPASARGDASGQRGHRIQRRQREPHDERHPNRDDRDGRDCDEDQYPNQPATGAGEQPAVYFQSQFCATERT